MSIEFLLTSLIIVASPGTGVLYTLSAGLSQSDLRIHFGLGEAAAADIEVHWPSGAVDALKGVRSNQILTVHEGAAAR